MTPEKFILKIVEAYQEARVPVVSLGQSRVRRGRSRSISGIAEDLLAEYLVSNDDSIDLVYVDQPIAVVGVKGNIYPDILLVRNGVIDTLIDLKLDIGWNRDGLTDLCKKHKQTVKELRGKKAHLRDGLTKEVKELIVSKKLTYNVVVVSRTNINPDKMQEHEKQIAKLRPEVELFILCDTGHPNSYDMSPTEVLKTLSVNDKVLQRLLKKI